MSCALAWKLASSITLPDIFVSRYAFDLEMQEMKVLIESIKEISNPYY
jgi:hypothetical protein